MQKGLLANFLNSPRWDSKIKSQNTTRAEIILGYFIGPWGMLMTNSIIISYFNQYLTDVVGFTIDKGAWVVTFMVLFPVFSKILDAVTNVIMSKLLDITVCRQGKVRPWLLISIPFVFVSVLMLFWMPFANPIAQAVWVVVAYNLYYSLAFTMWNMSKELEVALSTRNINQRRTNSISSTLVNSMGTGVLSIFFPTILSAVIYGICGGNSARGYFITMGTIACIMIPLTFIQYFYSRERITEERRNQPQIFKEKTSSVEASFKDQIRACLSNKYWILFMVTILTFNTINAIRVISLVYYSGWVINGNAYGNFAAIQRNFQMISMQPMFLGIFLVIPLMKKWGRRKVIWVGATLMIVGSILGFLGVGSTLKVYAGTALCGFGSIAFAYFGMSFMGDCIDHIEWKSHIRCDGFTSAIFGVTATLSAGIAQGIFNLGLGLSGYKQPTATGEIINGISQYEDQLPSATSWINFSYQGTFILLGIILFVIFLFFFKLEDELPAVELELQERKKAEYAAKGLVYMSPAELEAREIAQQESEAEEIRIRELREKCEKKGLDFDKENQKILNQRAKKEARNKK